MRPLTGRTAVIPAAAPAAPGKQEEAAADGFAAQGAEPLSVLVGEDNRDLLELLCLKLGRSFLVHAAANGIEALRVLESIAPPDAIVSDLMMDGMDGMELFDKLRENKRYNAIPFLFVTARNDEGERAASLEKGVIDFIYKPFSMDELQSKIEALLRYGEARRKINEREKASALGMALGGIAHEIFNPLSGISAPLSALKKIFFTADRPPGFEMKAEKHFRFIDENILRIENAVTVMKTLASDRQFDEVPLPIGEIVSRAAASAGLSEDGPVRLVTRVEKGTEILGDREGIYQVMRNLLANALDAIPAEGTITVVVENHDGNVVMTVSDTGRGIGKGELDLIFEPFYTTKEGKRGMGMGLFIVRQLCLKMSWNISVESMEGTGTVFTISQKRTLA